MIRTPVRPFSVFSSFSRIIVSVLAMGVALFCLAWPIHGLAQDAAMRPAHASEVVQELERHQWEEMAEGLALLDVRTALGTRMTALRVDLSRFRFAIAEQKKPKGERAGQVMERLDADIVVNGGFFSISGDEELKPVGMLIIKGEARSSAWVRDGGYLALDHEGIPSITLSADGPPMWARNAVQSKPVLIEPGGKWAMNTNGTDAERRTLLCLMPDNTPVLVLVHGGGLSLFEAGWALRGKEWGGYFGCDSAIALDGGSSTQMSVRDRPDLKISGLGKVQNFVVIAKRE